MRAAASTLRIDQAVYIAGAGLVLAAGLTLGAATPLPYLVVALPIVFGLSGSRPVYAFALRPNAGLRHPERRGRAGAA